MHASEAFKPSSTRHFRQVFLPATFCQPQHVSRNRSFPEVKVCLWSGPKLLEATARRWAHSAVMRHLLILVLHLHLLRHLTSQAATTDLRPKWKSNLSADRTRRLHELATVVYHFYLAIICLYDCCGNPASDVLKTTMICPFCRVHFEVVEKFVQVPQVLQTRGPGFWGLGPT